MSAGITIVTFYFLYQAELHHNDIIVYLYNIKTLHYFILQYFIMLINKTSVQPNLVILF